MFKEKTRYLILFKLLPRCCQLQMIFIHSSSSVSLSCSVEIRDYGCMIYGSARTSYFRALDAIDYRGLRLCLGAFITFPYYFLHVEAYKPPLDLCRLKLILQYIVKLKADIDNPAFDCVFHSHYDHFCKKCIKLVLELKKKHVEDSHYPLDIRLCLSFTI